MRAVSIRSGKLYRARSRLYRNQTLQGNNPKYAFETDAVAGRDLDAATSWIRQPFVLRREEQKPTRAGDTPAARAVAPGVSAGVARCPRCVYVVSLVQGELPYLG